MAVSPGRFKAGEPVRETQTAISAPAWCTISNHPKSGLLLEAKPPERTVMAICAPAWCPIALV